MKRSSTYEVLDRATAEQSRTIFYVLGRIKERSKLCRGFDAAYMFGSILFSMEVRKTGDILFFDVREDGKSMISVLRPNGDCNFFSDDYVGPATASVLLMREME